MSAVYLNPGKPGHLRDTCGVSEALDNVLDFRCRDLAWVANVERRNALHGDSRGSHGNVVNFADRLPPSMSNLHPKLVPIHCTSRSVCPQAFQLKLVLLAIDAHVEDIRGGLGDITLHITDSHGYSGRSLQHGATTYDS